MKTSIVASRALSRSLAALMFAAALGGVFAACDNPVVDAKIEALGGEREGVEQSEYHRPGQPCVLCHSTYEGASPQMVIGGTVFSDPGTFQRPVEDVDIVLYDAVGDVYTAKTNCIGNFYIEKGDRVPQFPLAAEIRCPTYSASGEKLVDAMNRPIRKVISMNSWLSRDGSCATCHSLNGRQVDSVGWLYCNDPTEVVSNPYPDVPDTCAGKPPREKGATDGTGGSP